MPARTAASLPEERIRRALATLATGNRALVGASDEPALSREMCRVIVEVGGYAMAWVAYADRDERKSIRAAAQFAADGATIPDLPTWDECDERGRSAAALGDDVAQGFLIS